jgi:hypothetical protein
VDNVERTIISQYGQSPTLRALIENMNEYIDPTTDFEAFYNSVWNVDTAVGFGLDIWGRIVGVSRLLRVDGGTDPIVGFDTGNIPYDWQTMSYGRWANNGEGTGGQAFELNDNAYRVLILTKALANISATNARSLNALLQNLFPGRGRVYVQDLGEMRMRFVFNFSLTPVERAIVSQSGVLPHPAGVFYSIIIVPSATYFGFRTVNPTSGLPFRYPGSVGAFNSRPN